jgi:hypothetical protein
MSDEGILCEWEGAPVDQHRLENDLGRASQLFSET